MTPIEDFLGKLININIWDIVKVLLLIALSLYLFFAYMVVREVDLMNRTLKGVFNLPIRLVAVLHFILAVAVFILAWIIL